MIPLSELRSIGFAGLLVTVFSLLLSVTLLARDPLHCSAGASTRCGSGASGRRASGRRVRRRGGGGAIA